MSSYLFTSDRLGFRSFTPEDAENLYLLCSNPDVMRYFPASLTRPQSDAFLAHIQEHEGAHGFSFWAVELRSTGAFIGFIGFLVISMEPLQGKTEIGWRMLPDYWHQGYATEGARACLRYGKDVLGLTTIYSFTAVPNQPSQQVMKRLGMEPQGQFNHPRLPGHSLERHVLYSLSL